MLDEGLKVVPMESMGSIRHEQISMENREGFSLKLIILYGSEYLISFVCVCVCVFWLTRAIFFSVTYVNFG